MLGGRGIRDLRQGRGRNVSLVSGLGPNHQTAPVTSCPGVVPGTELQHCVFWITFIRGGPTAANIVPVRAEQAQSLGFMSVSELVSTRGFENNTPNEYVTVGTWSGMSGEGGSPPGQISVVITLA